MTDGESIGTTEPKVLGRVAFMDGRGDLPMVEISTPWSDAEIYLHGAHVTHFKKHDEAPLLFLSQCSRFAPGQPIRGGIPIVFPWFGTREGLAQHGFARVQEWELKEFLPAEDGSVSVRFRLPESAESRGYPPFTADYIVTVDQCLRLQLIIKNESKDKEFLFENGLHTYFEVSDITAVSVSGLAGGAYLDKTASFLEKMETSDPMRISSEVDRTYLNATGPVEILDPRLGRRIRIDKRGSASTVVWNPWIAKSQQMSDFGNDEYERMLCVESGNVAANSITLAPGGSSALDVTLSSEVMK